MPLNSFQVWSSLRVGIKGKTHFTILAGHLTKEPKSCHFCFVLLCFKNIFSCQKLAKSEGRSKLFRGRRCLGGPTESLTLKEWFGMEI